MNTVKAMAHFDKKNKAPKKTNSHKQVYTNPKSPSIYHPAFICFAQFNLPRTRIGICWQTIISALPVITQNFPTGRGQPQALVWQPWLGPSLYAFWSLPLIQTTPTPFTTPWVLLREKVIKRSHCIHAVTYRFFSPFNLRPVWKLFDTHLTSLFSHFS